MPEPIMISIAAAVAGKGASSLYELVKSKLADRRSAAAALSAAEGRPADSVEVGVLAGHLDAVADEDPQFHERLVAAFTATRAEQSATTGGVNNQISGTVAGNVVQARDINGNVSFGG